MSDLDGLARRSATAIGDAYVSGEATTAAAATRRDAPLAAEDAPVVANAAAAGMISLGKLNLTEFAYSGLGLNPHHGTPMNLRAPGCAPGGSSSGSAVAVAVRLVPVAVGTDTGGSVRVPAAFTGLVGYRPSEERVDKRRVVALSPRLDGVGPLARSVENAILTDAALRGAAVGARPCFPLLVPEGVALNDLEPAVAAGFKAGLRRLEAAGVRPRRGRLSALEEAARLVAEHGTITAAEAYAEHRVLVEGPDVGEVDRRVVARILHGREMSAHDLLVSLPDRARLAGELASSLDGALLAMLATPIAPPEITPLEADDALFHRLNLLTLRNTVLGNQPPRHPGPRRTEPRGQSRPADELPARCARGRGCPPPLRGSLGRGADPRRGCGMRDHAAAARRLGSRTQRGASCCGPLPVSERLNLHEGEKGFAAVDDVVLDAGRPGIWRVARERDAALDAVWLLQQKLSVHQGDHDVVVTVPVPSRLGAGREAPFRDAHPHVVDVNHGFGG